MRTLGPARTVAQLAAAGETESSLRRALELHDDVAGHYARNEESAARWVEHQQVLMDELAKVKGWAP